MRDLLDVLLLAECLGPDASDTCGWTRRVYFRAVLDAAAEDSQLEAYAAEIQAHYGYVRQVYGGEAPLVRKQEGRVYMAWNCCYLPIFGR